MESSFFSKKRLFIAIGVVLAFLLLMDLNGRVSEMFRLSQERDALATVDANLLATQTFLQTQIAAATLPATVEEWAREEGHMVRPGDVLVIPIPEPGTTPVAEVKVIPTQKPVENWEIWWELFLGD